MTSTIVGPLPGPNLGASGIAFGIAFLLTTVIGVAMQKKTATAVSVIHEGGRTLVAVHDQVDPIHSVVTLDIGEIRHARVLRQTLLFNSAVAIRVASGREFVAFFDTHRDAVRCATEVQSLQASHELLMAGVTS